VIDLLGRIAEGWSWHDSHKDTIMALGKGDTPEYRAAIDEEMRHVRAAHAAVLAGKPVLENLLIDSDPLARSFAASTLARLNKDAADSVHALVAAAAVDPAPQAAASMILAVSHLGGTAADIGRIREARAGDKSPLTALALNLGELSILRDEAPRRLVVTVIAALIRPPTIPLPPEPWYEGHFENLIAARLLMLSPARIEPYVDDLIGVLASSRMFVTFWLNTLLIVTLFGQERRTHWNAAELTPRQRRFIVTLFDSRRVFDRQRTLLADSMRVMDTEPLEICGLPTRYQEFQTLAESCRRLESTA
jgi:hypothetical protein